MNGDTFTAFSYFKRLKETCMAVSLILIRKYFNTGILEAEFWLVDTGINCMITSISTD